MLSSYFEACALRARRAANVSFFVESHTGAIPPWEGRLLYTAQIDPHLIWGCEVTGVGTSSQLSQLEDVQHTFLRRLLGLQKRSQLCILFSETGLWPLKFRRLALQLRYLCYTLTLPPTHLASRAAQESISAAITSQNGWFWDLQRAARTVGLEVSNTPSPDNVAALEPALKTALYCHLQESVLASSKLELLHSRAVYMGKQRKAASPMEFRTYLKVKGKAQRQALTSLVLSDHCLAIEQLRRGTRSRSESVPRALRLCRFCLAAVEDPLHALFVCSASPDLRAFRRSFWQTFDRTIAETCAEHPTMTAAELLLLPQNEYLYALLSSVESASLLAVHAARVLSVYRDTPIYEPSDEEIEAYIEEHGQEGRAD